MSEERKGGGTDSDWQACAVNNQYDYSCAGLNDPDKYTWDWRVQQCVLKTSPAGKLILAYQRRMAVHTNQARKIVQDANERAGQRYEPSISIGTTTEELDEMSNLLTHIAHDEVLLQQVLCLLDLRQLIELEDLFEGLYDTLHKQYLDSLELLRPAGASHGSDSDTGSDSSIENSSESGSGSASESKRSSSSSGNKRKKKDAQGRVSAFGDDRQLYRIIFSHIEERKGWLAAHGTGMERRVLKGSTSVDELLRENKTVYVKTGASAGAPSTRSTKGAGRAAISGFKKKPIVWAWEQDHGRDWIPLRDDPIYAPHAEPVFGVQPIEPESDGKEQQQHTRKRKLVNEQRGAPFAKRPKPQYDPYDFAARSTSASTSSRFRMGPGGLTEVLGKDWFKTSAQAGASTVSTPTPSLPARAGSAGVSDSTSAVYLNMLEATRAKAGSRAAKNAPEPEEVDSDVD